MPSAKKQIMEFSNEVGGNPLVSVCVVTYQHREYIEECLDSILKQKTNFKFEIVLGEDESTDGTREICIDYARKYPHNIRLFLHSRENNISINGRATGRFNFLYSLTKARGKYVALCEGDDYWTDPDKLQRQVDFLESNPDFAICFHNAIVYNQVDQKKMFKQPGADKDTVYTLPHFLVSNPVATASVVFRRQYVEPIPRWFTQSPFADYPLYFLVLVRSEQKAMCLRDAMSVYRIHEGSIHGKAHLSNMGFVEAYKQHLEFWRIIGKHLLTDRQYQKNIRRTVAKTYSLVIEYLLRDNRYREALIYNTVFFFKLHFSFGKKNIKWYVLILMKMILGIGKRYPTGSSAQKIVHW